ncbi:MAG TPA: hypothetical protein VGM91_05980 [Conexibacter sp.]|jgi:hypothetical protein
MATQTIQPPAASQPVTETQWRQALCMTAWSLVARATAVADDRSGRPLAGLEHYADLLDLDDALPLSLVVRLARERAGLADAVALPATAGARATEIDFEAAAQRLVARTELPRPRTPRAERRAINATALIAERADAFARVQ